MYSTLQWSTHDVSKTCAILAWLTSSWSGFSWYCTWIWAGVGGWEALLAIAEGWTIRVKFQLWRKALPLISWCELIQPPASLDFPCRGLAMVIVTRKNPPPTSKFTIMPLVRSRLHEDPCFFPCSCSVLNYIKAVVFSPSLEWVKKG